MAGSLVISLDFELHWGFRDLADVDACQTRLLGSREAVPAILGLFARRGIHATWATVGMLFCRNKQELEATLPTRLPQYENAALRPYDLTSVGDDEASDPYHYAPTLIEAIKRTPGQEVGTHTFSHFYCLERGQTESDFDADLASARVAANRLGIRLQSLVFPRNQENSAYRGVLIRHGIRAYRSASRWPHSASVSADSYTKRAIRLTDAYLSLGGHRTLRPHAQAGGGLCNIAASMFLRPYEPRLAWLESLKVRRIARAMSYAANHGRVFHLWWHPHNFGLNLRENLAMLTALIDHFGDLRRTRGMQSLSMLEAATAS